MGGSVSKSSGCTDLSKILDDESLWLSSHHPARDENVLSRFGITHIVAITHVEAVHFPAKFEYKHLEFTDSRQVSLVDHFDVVNAWIDNARTNKGRVLVHCEAGMSRSASIIIGYLLGTSDESIRLRSVKDAYLFTKTKRQVIRPNYGFMNQVLEYSERVLNNDREPLFFAEYVIEVMALQKERITPEVLAPLLNEHKDDMMEALRIAIETENANNNKND